MKIFIKFLRDNLAFSIIYSMAVLLIISFYQMTTDGVEKLYPILIAAFFYLIYMLIRLWTYTVHYRTLNKLAGSAGFAGSVINEYQHAYDSLFMVYRRLGDEISSMKLKSIKDRRFISAYIHNLKTPVTVSSIIIQRVKNNEIDAGEAVTAISDELGRLTENLNTLLELQRLEELENDYQPQAVNLEKELEKIINSNKSLFINSHVYPRFERKNTDNLEQGKAETRDNPSIKEAEQILVYTDRKWNTVLINQIISNAVKYSYQNTSNTTKMKSSNEDIPDIDSQNKYITFSINHGIDSTDLVIQDEGIGIPEYDLPKIFDAFFTGENGRNGYNSSGIGLYLCKQICTKLNQQIKIENNNGCLATITYTNQNMELKLPYLSELTIKQADNLIMLE